MIEMIKKKTSSQTMTQSAGIKLNNKTAKNPKPHKIGRQIQDKAPN
jgi:ribosomal 50S subunit-recycling heat shock protein